MIVSSMNTCELIKEILLDASSVDRKANYLSDGLRRTAVKSKNKSFYQIFEYKSKRQNNWLIVINYFNGLPTFHTIVYYLNEQGINAISIGDNEKLYRFSPHFLIRYNERFLKQENISKLDILKRFISVNKAGITEIDDTNNFIFCRFTEGIALGDLEIIDYRKRIYHFRTFISNQMVYDDQQNSVELASEYYKLYGQELKKCTGIKSI